MHHRRREGRAERDVRARRAVRAFRRAPGEPAPDVLGGALAPVPGEDGVQRAGRRVSGAGVPAEMVRGGDSGDAQGAVPRDEGLHAHRGHARPRHDVPHVHDPGESGLFRRARHDPQVPHVARAAARRDRALRQLAVRGRQAQRVQEPALARVGGHGRGAHGDARVGVRG